MHKQSVTLNFNFFFIIISLNILSVGCRTTKVQPTALEKWHPTAGIDISRTAFDTQVHYLTKIMSTNIPMSDSQIIWAVRTSNTIGIYGVRQDTPYNNFSRLFRNICLPLLENEKEISANRGMGMYYPRLKIELGGMPSPSSLYNVIQE